MTRDELLALPPNVAIKVLLQALAKTVPSLPQELARIDAPKTPRPPKYDLRISRKGGYQWASETDLEGLRWWLNRFEVSAAEGGQYSDKDAKRAEKLRYWVDWRECYPDTPWSGQRNDEPCKASAPVAKPAVHEWEPRGHLPLTPRGDAQEEPGGDDSFPDGW
jgi:hypothetical protein